MGVARLNADGHSQQASQASQISDQQLWWVKFTVCLRSEIAGSQDLDSYTHRFEFLARGAANVVFRIVPAPTADDGVVFLNRRDELVPHFEENEMVLRISKGEAKTPTSGKILRHYTEDIMPWFESHEKFLMVPKRVDMSKKVWKKVAAQLDSHEMDESALLLPYMGGIPGAAFAFEIKPKWLLQSPDAPEEAVLCRTCAMHASRKGKLDDSYLCPLQLLEGNSVSIEKYLAYRIKKHAKDENLSEEAQSLILDRALPYLVDGPGHEILLHLRKLQAEHDPKGIRHLVDATASPSSAKSEVATLTRDMRLAMTFRDCSLLIRVPYKGQDAIEAKLVDLDFKSASKIPSWNSKEVELSEGWYMRSDTGLGCHVAQ